MLFAGQRAMVVGANGAIGRAIAEDLLQEGCDLAVTFYRRDAEIQSLLAVATRAGRRCRAYRLDVRDQQAVAETCRQASEDLEGHPSLLVSSAGILRDHPVAQLDPDDWRAVLETNLFGPYYFIRELAPLMIRQQMGRIVSIASVSGLFGQPGQANYAASKGGVIAMTRALARELGPFNITVNAVAPGLVDTEMIAELAPALKRQFLHRIPLRRFAAPADLVPAVRLLLSPQAAYITGQVLVVDGGLTC
jgi:3-oxoacyl-[acyl-carrier protein] reductase